MDGTMTVMDLLMLPTIRDVAIQLMMMSGIQMALPVIMVMMMTLTV
jgi:hypothetical protein